jgi:uncharacterized lipoprotein YddW (UPF0748 family)
MTLIRTLATLWVVVAFLHPLPAQTPPKREFRAAWVTTVSNLDWPSTRGFNTVAQQNELITIFDNLKANGITGPTISPGSRGAVLLLSMTHWSLP